MLALTHPTRAAEPQPEQARVLYSAGLAAFGAQQYAEAATIFRRGYQLSHKPEFLYNTASALEADGRPHEAAQTLQAYLRAVPRDDQRGALEGRVRALEDAQRLLDAERLRREPPTLRSLSTEASPRWTRAKAAALVLGVVTGAVAAGLGVGLGLGLQPSHTRSTLDTHVVTP
jgi:tetratricopeptide (TPR) repeat protein